MIAFYLTLQALLADRIERNDKGATMIEYGLMVVGVAVVVGASAAALGTRIDGMFDLIIP